MAGILNHGNYPLWLSYLATKDPVPMILMSMTRLFRLLHLSTQDDYHFGLDVKKVHSIEFKSSNGFNYKEGDPTVVFF